MRVPPPGHVGRAGGDHCSAPSTRDDCAPSRQATPRHRPCPRNSSAHRQQQHTKVPDARIPLPPGRRSPTSTRPGGTTRCTTRLTSRLATAGCARLPRPCGRRASDRFVTRPLPGGPRVHPWPQAHHRENPVPARTQTRAKRESSRFLGRSQGGESGVVHAYVGPRSRERMS